MRVSHGVTAVFDDPNLVSCAGLVPVLRLAEQAGLHRLVVDHVRVGKPGGGNAHLKVPTLVAGMVAGADSIEDMTLLRHGGMPRLFTGVRAPSTLGTFLRTFTFGHVRQLDAVASRLLINVAARVPLLPGAATLAYVDIDDTVRQTYGYAKAGAGRGYTGVKGLNALLATVCTPDSAPVIAAARLRKGSTNSARGAARLVADALVTARAAGATGVRVLRADSAFYSYDVIAAALRHHSCFSITARQDPAIRKAIAAIDHDGWTPIKYTDAVFDADQQRWISDAEVAEIDYTAFTSKAKRQARHRPADRAAGQRHEPEQPERAVHRLPLPRRVHQQPAADARRRAGAPWARDRRTSHRRLEERATRAPTVRAVLGQQRLAGLRGDRFQPHPRRWRPRVDLPRQGDHRHDPRATDHHPRTARSVRAAAHAAPAPRLAMGTRLAAHARRNRATGRSLRRVRPSARTRPHHRGEPAGSPGHSVMPSAASNHRTGVTSSTHDRAVDPGLDGHDDQQCGDDAAIGHAEGENSGHEVVPGQVARR
jgi:DDE family transposase